MKTHSSDIVIIGGGLVGLSAALALQKRGQNITVLETAKRRKPATGGINARAIALSYTSVQLFKALDIWDAIKELVSPIKHIHVSCQGRWGITRLQAGDYALDAFGYVVESHLLLESLLSSVRASKQITLLAGIEFEGIETDDPVRIHYRHQEHRHRQVASLVLIADGVDSRARAELKIKHQTIDYAQSAIITTVTFDQPRFGHAYERFTQQGPLALLPLSGNRYACVWVREKRPAAVLAQADDASFRAALQQCFGYRLGYIEQVGERFCFDLKRIQSERFSSGRCVLIGNAATTLHPLAGQGFNLALRDLAALYALFADKQISQLDETAIVRQLHRYQSQRQAEHRQITSLGDSIVHLFSSRVSLLSHLGSAGLALIEQLPPLKTQVVMSGMGCTFGGSALLRGRR